MASLVPLVANKVLELIVYHANLIKGVKKDLEQLHNKLKELDATLELASRNQDNNALIKVWESRARTGLYEVEDTIDTYLTTMDKIEAKNILGRAMDVKKIFDQAKDVKSMTDKVKSLFDDFMVKYQAEIQRSGVGTAVDQPIVDIRRQGLRERKDIVGFETEIETITKFMSEESNKFQVYSIVGMGGLGKTTVARKVYESLRTQFLAIWVIVSQQLNKKEFFLTILKTFIKQDLSSTPVHELSAMVSSKLKEHRCLIFIDDVWSVSDWKSIEEVIKSDMCKVLITTRELSVSSSALPHCTPHVLRFLTADESWKLLKLEVYGAEGVVPGNLEQFGKDIARDCDGLPLSIIIVGGILKATHDVETSSHVLENKWRKVAGNVSRCITHDDKEGQMNNFIQLSYTRLPYNMRACFQYLGVFPEDTEIPTWKIFQLWVSEGFIPHTSGNSLEEVAEANLHDLISRNLVMIAANKLNGEVKTCRIHDSIRQFCKKEASSAEQHLFEEIKFTKEGQLEDPAADARRLCISSSQVHDFFLKKKKFPKVRSFLCILNDPIIWKSEDIKSVEEAFSLLRVFHAEKIIFPSYPLKIMAQENLRFLTLAGEFKILPFSVSNLWNLLTLIIHTSNSTLEVEADLSKLVRLRLFKSNAGIILKKDIKDQGGKNLHTVTKLSPISCTKSVFEKANALTTLGIRGDISILLESKCLETLRFLNKLKLVHDEAYEKALLELPQPNMFPPNITILTLSGTSLEWIHMSTLAKLCGLKVLKLKETAFKGSEWNADCGGFGCLEFLHIATADLEYWKVSNGTLSGLKRLVLKSCEQLLEVPLDLANTLELLKMETVHKSVVEAGKEIEKRIESAKRRGFKLEIALADLKKLD